MQPRHAKRNLRRALQLAALVGLGSCGGGGGDGDGGGGSGPFGLETRPGNSSCIAGARPGGNATVTTVDAFPTAPDFDQPTKMLQAPGDGSRWFVLEKTGRVRVFNVANPAAASTWLDFSSQVDAGSEGGLLGMAFHPNYPATREVFVSYTTTLAGQFKSHVSRVRLDDVSAPSAITEEVLLVVDQPFKNHNGGDIAFGPDGYLYFGLGDGGSADDPYDNSQNPTRLLGSMLRIAVIGVGFPTPGYNIPADNPYAGNPKCGPADNAAACPEIYAIGLRNPWRWSFDTTAGIAGRASLPVRAIALRPMPATRSPTTRIPTATSPSPAVTSTVAMACPACRVVTSSAISVPAGSGRSRTMARAVTTTSCWSIRPTASAPLHWVRMANCISPTTAMAASGDWCSPAVRVARRCLPTWQPPAVWMPRYRPDRPAG
ncbi:MAG: hypothetical protein DYH20_14690 [Gammaproteobacteria bacterium PRO9]|nr:hypothetical protein [Gammaproteobacteria bacterium PRO9]